VRAAMAWAFSASGWNELGISAGSNAKEIVFQRHLVDDQQAFVGYAPDLQRSAVLRKRPRGRRYREKAAWLRRLDADVPAILTLLPSASLISMPSPRASTLTGSDTCW